MNETVICLLSDTCSNESPRGTGRTQIDEAHAWDASDSFNTKETRGGTSSIAIPQYLEVFSGEKEDCRERGAALARTTLFPPVVAIPVLAS